MRVFAIVFFMQAFFSFESLALPFATFIFWLGTVFTGHASTGLVKEQKYLNPPPTEYIEHTHFGFSESLADSLWLRWIQDNDYCQIYSNKNDENLERPAPRPGQVTTPLPDTVSEDKFVSNPRYKICDNSWGFKMLDAITRLAPKFQMAYLAGPISLSVMVEDYEGATVLFERGLKEFPDDWQLAYRASYHFLFDKKDLPRAADLLNHAATHGGPNWLKSLAARLYSRSGQLILGISTLKNYREQVKDNLAAVEDVDKRIAELERQLQEHP